MTEPNDLEPLDAEVTWDEESDGEAEELDHEYTEDEPEGFARDMETLLSEAFPANVWSGSMSESIAIGLSSGFAFPPPCLSPG